ncbi:hypothetical protein [Streptomyces sp. NPDC097981]|uniref:hypothetical protein n=1 Tax=Streptomyces sp. NPDC097981 TaxID=3155428 RepID=UPI00332C4EBF
MNDFYSQNVNPVRFQVLFTTLGIALFLWFLGPLWRVLGEAEGGPARGTTVAPVGAGVASVLMLVGLSGALSLPRPPDSAAGGLRR